MSIAQIIGLVVVLLLAGFLGFLIVKKSEKHDLFKWLGLFTLVTIVLTWIFKGGYFAGSTFQTITEEPNAMGFTDLYTVLSYGVQTVSAKALFLLAVGAFYGVMVKTNSYKKLVSTLVKKLHGKEIIFVILASLVFVAMGSLFTQSLIAVVFIPFVISIILGLKLDKMTAFVTTFGSLLIGLLGVTYGYEGLSEFNYYLSMYVGETPSINIIAQLIVLVVAYVVMNFVTVTHAKKILKNKKLNETEADPFLVEKTTKKASLVPCIVIFSLLFVLIVLGYIGWESAFGIKAFTTFHKWLTELKLFGFPIFGKILGTQAAAFGAWDLTVMTVILLVIAFLFMVINWGKITLSDMAEGLKKMIVPVMLLIGVQVLLYVANYSPTIPVIIDSMVGGMNSFNPFVTAGVALISSVFQPDLGFNGLTVAGYFAASYADYASLAQTIFVTVYGLVQLFVPTSAVLLIGLSYLKIDYKSWIKYIWMFALGLIVILLVLFTVLAYI